MESDLRKKILEVRDRLLDPFSVEDIERDFTELYSAFRRATPEEIVSVREEFEEIRRLLLRNLSIIAGGLRPVLEKGQGGLFSRRV